MDWQELVALSIVAATAGLFAWSKVRRRSKFSFERDTHCGCSSPSSGNRNSIIIQGRRGEAPHITVKMN